MAPRSKLTSDMLANLESPFEVRLSPSAKQVVYTLRAMWNRPKGRWVSSLWLADVGKQHSTRQITSGESNDSWPQWSNDGKSIAFLSDRAKEGVASIWILSLAGDKGAEPIALTTTDLEKAVEQFTWSDDGKYIAYLSVDEKSAERRAKEESKNDAEIFGEYYDYGRLRIVEVATRKVTTLVSKDCHVYDFAWSTDSKSIAYVTQAIPEYEAHITEGGTSIVTIQLDNQKVTELVTIPGYVEDLCWTRDDLWWRSRYDMLANNSSKVVYKMSVSDKKYSRYGYGEDSCASAWAFPPGLIKVSEDELIVQVQSGLNDQFHLIPAGTKLHDEMVEFRSWDATLQDGQPILVVVKSSAEKPLEVYSVVGGETVCLSDHGKEIAELELATTEAFYAKAEDGTDLDAVLIIPKNYDTPKPWPTIVCPHGGPYSRTSVGFDQPNFLWAPWFASLGYAVLCPNYRGGSGHGEAFAAAVRADAGGYVYTDTIDVVKAAVTAGIIDPNRVGIAGWSYGGIIAYLAVARDSTFHFQAAMCGAGIVDWDLSIMTTIGWRTAIQVAGYAPWEVEMNNTHNRIGSAVWHMQDIKTPVLILHGADDPIVPTIQAKAFYRGCQYRNNPCELVIYPREGHGVFPPLERLHFIDMLERMKTFFGKHVGVVVAS